MSGSHSHAAAERFQISRQCGPLLPLIFPQSFAISRQFFQDERKRVDNALSKLPQHAASLEPARLPCIAAAPHELLASLVLTNETFY